MLPRSVTGAEPALSVPDRASTVRRSTGCAKASHTGVPRPLPQVGRLTTGRKSSALLEPYADLLRELVLAKKQITLREIGFVTGSGARSQRPERRVWLGRSRGRLPCKGGLGPERLERAAGDEVALDGGGVVNRRVHRQKALG